ncbi:G2/mitotic-specific cyclin-A [Exaiptasia diaphana]|uniref:Cyclin A n=1 Tax=Exaiptasia diaphana TaxID=2652724 RepID=A0A913XUW4_EXADI|nr:G2/mitotic-specific cyclin-A [Exaiptasia diaphana]KXJ28471.1 G2/mitotic-specific cyclin-A [Exaiptasia diaphana]
MYEMSFAFGGAYQLSNNSNQEIQVNNAFKKARLEDGQVKVQKRAALGTITNNVQLRVQPHRAAKAVVTSQAGLKNDENAYSHRVGKSAFAVPQTTQQSFSIHVDNEPKLSKVKENEVGSSQESFLKAAVTGLSRPALTSVFTSREGCEDSPMVIDSDVSSDDEEFEAIATEKAFDEIEASVDPVLEVSEYAEEMFRYLKAAETKYMPKSKYMRKQADINSSMRAILVDWLVEVGEEYKLLPQTLYLTVNYIDRFLSMMSVLRGKLQLVGTACMLLASKFEEIYPPEVSEFVYITDDTYTAKQLLKMEQLVLKALTFDLSVPTTLNFLERYLKATKAPENLAPKVESLARYLCEISLLDCDPFLEYVPSTIAASAVVLSLHTLGLPHWNEKLSSYSGYELHQLQSCIQDLHRAFSHASKHPQKAIRDKYSSSKYHHVSTAVSPPEFLPMV